MLMFLFNSSCLGGCFWFKSCFSSHQRDEGGTASVGGVVTCCDRDEEGGETSMTFSTSDDSDGLLPKMKVKNTH